ncbi:MAG TPA: hypothetical protein VGH74_14930, partial [Planctomycetaceae bacterium]
MPSAGKNRLFLTPTFWLAVSLSISGGCRWHDASTGELASARSFDLDRLTNGSLVGGCQDRAPAYRACAAEQARPQSQTEDIPWPANGSADELAQRFFSLAGEAQRDNLSCSPDYFYQSAIYCWQCLFRDAKGCAEPDKMWQIYHTSVAGLISEGERCGRFDGRGQIVIYQPGATLTIPFACLGLPWQPLEIDAVKVVVPPVKSKVTHYHACAGFGVPVVALRKTGSYRRREETFLPP